MNDISKIINKLDPQEAAAQTAAALKQLLPLLGEEGRARFIMELIGESGTDKISSMVHLGLAECMGEGVDPTQMCQSLVDKVAQSKQLMAITDPELLVLFEDWLEELEEEVVQYVDRNGPVDADRLAGDLGLSQRGARFLLSKLQREEKIGPGSEFIQSGETDDEQQAKRVPGTDRSNDHSGGSLVHQSGSHSLGWTWWSRWCKADALGNFLGPDKSRDIVFYGAGLTGVRSQILLGLPLFVLALFSGQINRLPRSGGWMLWVRKLMGWVLIGMAVHFLRPLMSESVSVFMTALIVVAAGIHLGWLDHSQADFKAFAWAKSGTSIACLVFATFLIGSWSISKSRWGAT